MTRQFQAHFPIRVLGALSDESPDMPPGCVTLGRKRRLSGAGESDSRMHDAMGLSPGESPVVREEKARFARKGLLVRAK